MLSDDCNCYLSLTICYLLYVACFLTLSIWNLLLLAKTCFLLLVVVRLVIFSVLRVWLLLTVNIDHPVSMSFKNLLQLFLLLTCCVYLFSIKAQFSRVRINKMKCLINKCWEFLIHLSPHKQAQIGTSMPRSSGRRSGDRLRPFLIKGDSNQKNYLAKVA